MRFVIEIPDQLVPAAASGDTAASPGSDTFSGGPAPGASPLAVPTLAADSGGEAEYFAGGIAIARRPDEAIDGGAAPSGT